MVSVTYIEQQLHPEPEKLRPLADIRVIDLTHAMSGPYCTLMLADMGADVIKVEPSEGDESRRWMPPDIRGESAYFLSVNRNKRSIVLDLKREEGREILYRLVRISDVLVENFRPGVADRLGVGFERVAEINPRIIYCSISGFGQTGPYRDRPGYDVIALAMSGLMSITGEAGGEPVKFGVPIADITTGMYAAFAIVNALRERDKTSRGAYLDLSLLDVQVALLTHQAGAYFASREEPQRLGSAHASIAPYQAFKAKDGYVIIGAANDKLWQRLCEALGIPGLLEDPRFRTNQDRVRNRSELIEILSGVIARESVDVWVKRLERAGVPAAPVKRVGEALRDEHVLARGMIETVRHPKCGEIKLLSSPIMIDGKRPESRLPPPMLGEHTDEVLSMLGLSGDEIRELREKGVVG